MAPHNRHITHYIPPVSRFADLEKEFVAPSPEAYFIHWLFRYRCMECKGRGEEINEIIPRARSKKSILDWKNRVVLCRNCHTNFHAKGITMEKIKIMQEQRKEFLILIDRGAYV